MNTLNVTAGSIRANLTELISGLDADNRVAVTKHGKVIAFLVAPTGFNGVWSRLAKEEVEEDEVEEDEVDAGGVVYEITPVPNHESDPDLDEEFESFLSSADAEEESEEEEPVEWPMNWVL